MDINRTREIVESFKNHEILVVGDVMLDHYVHGDVERLNPEAPVPILRARREHEEVGGAANVAKYASQMGAESILIGVVGEDRDADIVDETSNKNGYKSNLVRDASRPTIRKTRHIVENKTVGQQLLRVDFEETHELSREVEDRVIEAIRQAVDEEDIKGIVVSDYAKGVVTKRVAAAILDLAGEKDLLVAADVKPSRAKYFVGATFISPNMKEAHEYVGINLHEEEVEDKELAKLVSMKMCSDVYLTMGAKGVYVYCGGECGDYVQQTATAIEPSCAGDAAITLIMLCRLSGATEVESAVVANAGCSVIVNKVGSGSLSKDEVNEAYRVHLEKMAKEESDPNVRIAPE